MRNWCFVLVSTFVKNVVKGDQNQCRKNIFKNTFVYIKVKKKFPKFFFMFWLITVYLLKCGVLQKIHVSLSMS